MKAVAFSLQIPDAAIRDLKHRLALARRPDEVEGCAWDYGTSLAPLKSVVDRWREAFDWRRAEHRPNALAQFHMEVEGQKIHYVHIKGSATPHLSF